MKYKNIYNIYNVTFIRTFCDSDNDCPSYTYCKRSTDSKEIYDIETGEIKYQRYKNNYCAYFDFLCPEDENANCYYIDEIYKYSYDEKFRPIMDTCMKDQVDDGICKTKKCESNDDCFSGSCYSNSCVTNTSIYKCKSFEIYFLPENKNRIHCEKMKNMKCSSDEECIDGNCNNGYCAKLNFNDNGITLWSLVVEVIEILITMIILFFIVYIILLVINYFKKKNEYEPLLKKKNNEYIINNNK